MATTKLSGPRIAIIGAGPVGCMLARLLHLADIECTVFEGEDSPNYRSQGGTLDLHTDTGLAAMREAGLAKDFEELARYDGEAMKMMDEKCKILMQLEASGKDKTRLAGSRPEIDRSLLRQLLGQSLPEGMIRWGHHLKRVEEDGRLVFRNGTESGFDLIVGAEGAWSKVRKVLSDQMPVYSGLSMYELAIPEPETRTPELYKLVNRGSVFAHSQGRELVIQQMGSGELHVYAIFKADESWMEEQRKNPPALAEVKEILIGKNGTFVDYDKTLKDGLAKCKEKCIPRQLHMLPVGFRWKHRRGFTIIGDAAHAMTPFAGEGVNVGLKDALDLSAAIIAAVKNDNTEISLADRLDKAVEKHEIEMGPRVDGYTTLTNDLMNIWFFSSEPPEKKIVKAMSKFLSFNSPYILRPFAGVGVQVYYAMKNALGSVFGW
ncbi:hypothetical protein PspLS_05674 [Pyricularia sp. CBS 133598]|nr:hypothetical protein PspLS_05674 [Pyricularia sp. CBS 133598]